MLFDRVFLFLIPRVLDYRIKKNFFFFNRRLGYGGNAAGVPPQALYGASHFA